VTKSLLAAIVLIAALPFAWACGSGGGGIGFVLKGRVFLDPELSQGAPGVRVWCPAAGVQAISDGKGNYTLEGTVEAEPSGDLPRLGVWFEGEGRAAVSKTFRPIPGVEATAVVVLGKALTSQTVAVPGDKQSQAVTLGNATVTLFQDSLVDQTGLRVTGEVEVNGATWEPVFADRVTIPVHPMVEPIDGGSDFVTPLVMTRFSFAADGGDLNIGGTQGVGLYMTSVNPMDGPITKDDDRLFVVDPMTGVLMERPSNKLDPQHNVLQAPINESGTWVWARDVAQPTCVNVHVSYAGGGPVLGADVRLAEDPGNGKDGLVLDEQIGVPGGIYCLRAPVGKTFRLRAWLSGAGGIREASQNVLTGAGGDCVQGCPKSFDIEFECESDLECPAGSVCDQGACVAGTAEEGGV